MTFNPLQIALLPLFKQAQDDDALFAIEVEEKSARQEKKKSFDECCDYVLGEAYKYAKEHQDGNVGLAFADESMVIGMMKHYWDEDDIEITPVGGARVAVKTTKDTKTENGKAEPVKAKKQAKKAEAQVAPVKIPVKAKTESKAEEETEVFEQGSLWS